MTVVLSLDDRAIVVLSKAWGLLPAIKSKAVLTAVGFEDLGAKNGQYSPDDGRLAVNSRLFFGEHPQMIALFDIDGNDPPQCTPFCSRALHTCTHELWHAIGEGTGLDKTPEWLSLSGFAESPVDLRDSGRYWESRPGWSPLGPSEWRYHKEGTWFPRAYSSRSPFECFADCCAHIALGWESAFTHAPLPLRKNALAKLAYLRREVWQEKGLASAAASRQRWQAARQPQTKKPIVLPPLEDELLDAIEEVNDQQRRDVLRWLPRQRGSFFDHDKAVEALAFAMAPILLRAYRQAWSQHSSTAPVIGAEVFEAIQRAAESYVTTTATRLTQALTAPDPAVAIDFVYAKSSTARAPQMAKTEAHRMEQAAQEAVWQASGEVTYKVWHTTSAEPCGFCVALEGTRIAVGQPFFLKGATIMDAAGKKKVLEYEDVYTPPLHISCGCELREE